MSQKAQNLPVLSVFNFRSHQVRTVIRDGDPWFILSDVADALGYRDASNAGRCLSDRQRADTQIVSISQSGAKQSRSVTIINESGLYRLVLRSRKPEAVMFSDWVTSEVLPSIRKTGSYSVADRSKERVQRAYDMAADIRRASLEALLKCGDWQPDRLLVSFDENGTAWVQPIEDRALVASMERLAQMISQPGAVMATDSELAMLAQACSARLMERLSFKSQLRIVG